jgi:peroxiredoxin Q/BCP
MPALVLARRWPGAVLAPACAAGYAARGEDKEEGPGSSSLWPIAPPSVESEGGSMAKTPQVGEEAPDFELPGTDGTFKLSGHRGERVVLLFYPGDNTMVCTKQFCSYRDRADDFAALDATVVGISSQDLDSHKGFIEKHGLTVPLLADVDKSVAKSYSAFSSRLGTKRAAIVIDEQGVVRHRHDHMLGLDYQSVDELKATLDSLPTPAT